MTFTFSAYLTHYSFTHKDYLINNLTNLIFKVENKTSVDDSKISLKGLKIRIEHVKNKDDDDTHSALTKSIKNQFTRSTLLKCPRIEIGYEKESQHEKYITDSSLVLQILPITVNLGFIEINEFKIVYQRIIEISNSIYEKNQYIIKKMEQEYKDSRLTMKELVGNYFTSMVDKNLPTGESKKIIKPKLAKQKETNYLKILIAVEHSQLSLVDDLGL